MIAMRKPFPAKKPNVKHSHLSVFWNKNKSLDPTRVARIASVYLVELHKSPVTTSVHVSAPVPLRQESGPNFSRGVKSLSTTSESLWEGWQLVTSLNPHEKTTPETETLMVSFLVGKVHWFPLCSTKTCRTKNCLVCCISKIFRFPQFHHGDLEYSKSWQSLVISVCVKDKYVCILYMVKLCQNGMFHQPLTAFPTGKKTTNQTAVGMRECHVASCFPCAIWYDLVGKNQHIQTQGMAPTWSAK